MNNFFRYRLTDASASFLSGCISFVVLFFSLSVAQPSSASILDVDDETGQQAILDSLFQQVNNNYSTVAGLACIDRYIEAAQACHNDSALGNGYEYKAGCYINMSMYDELDHLVDSIDVNAEPHWMNEQSLCYIKYIHAMSYIYRGKYRFAIHKAQELYEDLRGYDMSEMPQGISDEQPPLGLSNRLYSLRCLGMAYSKLKLRRMSVKYFEEALDIARHFPVFYAQEIIDINCDIMLATFYLHDKRHAFEYIIRFEDALREYEKISDTEQSDLDYFNFLLHVAYSEIYCELDDIKQSEVHLDKVRAILATSELAYFYVGNYYKACTIFYTKTGDYDKAMAYADSTIQMCHEESDFDNEISVGKLRFKAAIGAGHYGEACSYANRIMELTDSINERRFMSTIEEFGSIVDLDKMQMVAERSKAEERIWSLITLCVIFVAFFMVVCILVYFNNRRAAERQHILSEQKEILEAEVKMQTAELRHKNRDITDSITYARRIQNAILPDISKLVSPEISESFTFYRPCEILSGDFYWAARCGDELMVACADCTGHGVPGALMAMMGSTILNEICMNGIPLTPSEMLNRLDAQLLSVLGQNEESDVKDGIDIALVSYNHQLRRLRISSARRYVYLYKGDELIRIKGARRSIADREDINRARKFEDVEYQVESGDMLYLDTDGFVDQFGGQDEFGSQGERFNFERLIKMLESIRHLPLSEQKEAVERTMDQWQGSCPQVDDMAMVGIRF